MPFRSHPTPSSTSRRASRLTIVVLAFVALAGAVCIVVGVQSTDPSIARRRLLETGRPLDLAIVGEGFFQINDGNRFLYTRAGSFSINSDFAITLKATRRDRLLEPSIHVPSDATQMKITSDGYVWVLLEGQSELTEIGELQLASFTDPKELTPVGEGLYAASAAAGVPLISVPGNCGLGQIRQRHLEVSNFKPVHKFVGVTSISRN